MVSILIARASAGVSEYRRNQRASTGVSKYQSQWDSSGLNSPYMALLGNNIPCPNLAVHQKELKAARRIHAYQPGRALYDQATRGPWGACGLAFQLRDRPASTSDMPECCEEQTTRADTIMTMGAMGDLGVSGDSSQQLTSFFNEATCKLEVRAGGIPDVETYRDTAAVDDVKRYLSRPQVFTSGTWNSSNPNPMVTLNVGLPLWTTHTHYSKVLGSFGMRATTCFKLVVAATPYHAGILRLAFTPFNSNVPHDNWTLTQYSQMPGVELNLADGTSLELRVPFIHELNYFEVNNTNADQNLGTVNLLQYTGLVVAPTADQVPYTLYWWLEDIELIGAIPSTIALDYVAAQQRILDLINPIPMQANVIEEEANATRGSFSQVANAASTLATSVGRFIPSLSSVTGPTAWFLRQTSKVAASFGYSKPQTTAAVNRVIPTAQTYQWNVDGFDTSYNLGATVDTRLALTKFAGTDIDEMSFGFLTSIYSRIDSILLQKSAGVNTSLWYIQLQPSLFYDREASTAYRATTPLYMLQNYFQYWRGSLKFRFKIAKTQFHTGRIVVGYLPNNENSTTLPSVSAAMDYKSVVWDLKESSVLDFEVPYIWNQAYRAWYENTGILFIKVLDPLRAPEMVASSVPIIVEVAGGEDIEFAVPTDMRTRMTLKTPTLFREESAPREEPIPLQAAEFVQHTTPYCEQCIGNRILSIKSLLSRPVLSGFAGTSSANCNWPNLVISQDAYGDNYMAPLLLSYTLYRGGWRFSYVPVNPNHTLGVITQPPGTPAPGPTSTYPQIWDKTAIHATVPYHSTRSRVIIKPNGLPTSTVNFRTSGSTDLNTDCRVWCGFAEDLQLGYFRCCPFALV